MAMIHTYPKEFTDYLCERFGLEWLDYVNKECYGEWCAARESIAKAHDLPIAEVKTEWITEYFELLNVA